jgi:hypothetical protein
MIVQLLTSLIEVSQVGTKPQKGFELVSKMVSENTFFFRVVYQKMQNFKGFQNLYSFFGMARLDEARRQLLVKWYS